MDLTAIRDGTHKGLALGSDRFKQQIERLTQRRTTSKGVGRPRLDDSLRDGLNGIAVQGQA